MTSDPAPEPDAVKRSWRTIRAADALGGKPHLSFDVDQAGRLTTLRASVELDIDQAERIQEQLERLRAIDDEFEETLRELEKESREHSEQEGQ